MTFFFSFKSNENEEEDPVERSGKRVDWTFEFRKCWNIQVEIFRR